MLEALMRQHEPAVLVLADGRVFPGFSIGATGEAVGEVVFNTAMTGYQEILTDPSYADQMVTLTYPHIGNVGINVVDCESDRVWAKGLIIRELSQIVSNFRAEKSLSDYLKEQNVVGIAGIDTRALTRHLRDKGAQNGCIVTGTHDPKQALQKAKAFPGLEGKDLAKQVTIGAMKEWTHGTYDLTNTHFQQRDQSQFHVVAYDFGVKQQILRLLADRYCRVTLVPATMPAADVIALNPDGVFLSNGPGDPAACDYAIANIQQLLEKNIPTFGICLGFQLLALACGAKTLKMKFGHHGANHPVKNLQTNQVYITSQNHGFAVDADTLPDDLKVTHVSLFDGTLQGIMHQTKPAFAFQGHPEASPGPHDIVCLFDDFINLMQANRQQTIATSVGQ